MTSLPSNSSLPGIIAIIAGVVLVSILITVLFGYVIHWLPVVLGISIGLMAVRAING